jgi:pimeloyl-ACP methyl ester carboxylesterase
MRVGPSFFRQSLAVAAVASLAALAGCGPDTVTLGPTDTPEPAPEDAGELDDVPPPLSPPAALSADDADSDADAPAVYDADPDEPAPLGPPYPIVLVHGFSGFTDLGPLDYWFGVVDHLQAQDVEVFAPAQPPYQATELRAEVLGVHVDAILATTGHEKVHLICHSQGGLDCRFLASRLGYADRIADIITIATPHRGTDLADLAEIAPAGLVGPAGQLLAWLLGLLEGEPPDEAAWDTDDEIVADNWEADLAAAIDSMTEDGAARFNDQTPDHPRVPVFSVAGVANSDGGELCDAGGLLFGPIDDEDTLDPLLIGPSLAISGMDDGVVPLASMPWGTFLGCVPADHLDQVGQIAGQGFSDFDHLDFMDTLVDFVREREAEESAE